MANANDRTFSRVFGGILTGVGTLFFVAGARRELLRQQFVETPVTPLAELEEALRANRTGHAPVVKVIGVAGSDGPSVPLVGAAWATESSSSGGAAVDPAWGAAASTAVASADAKRVDAVHVLREKFSVAVNSNTVLVNSEDIRLSSSTRHGEFFLHDAGVRVGGGLAASAPRLLVEPYSGNPALEVMYTRRDRLRSAGWSFAASLFGWRVPYAEEHRESALPRGTPLLAMGSLYRRPDGTMVLKKPEGGWLDPRPYGVVSRLGEQEIADQLLSSSRSMSNWGLVFGLPGAAFLYYGFA